MSASMSIGAACLEWLFFHLGTIGVFWLVGYVDAGS